jgi:hypothetical protein
MGWVDARRFTRGSRPVGTVAHDGNRRSRRRSQPVQHTEQLVPLPIRLRGHAAENDLLAVIVADLGKHHLERADLITSDRAHVATVDGERDCLCLGRQRGG